VRRWWLVAALVCLAGPAEARIVIGHDGRHAWPAGPVPAPWHEQVPDGFEAGFSCETVGLLWADLATWACRPCLINDATQTTMSLDGAPAAMLAAIEASYAPGDVRRGLWEAHGRWGLLMIGLSLVGAFTARRRRAQASAATTDDDDARDEATAASP
jgi:hypothetical protein